VNCTQTKRVTSEVLMVLQHKHMLLIARTDVCATKQCKSISWHGCHCCCWMLLGYVDITMCLSDIVKPVWWVRVVTPEIDTHTQPFNCPVSRTTCTRRRIHPLTSILVIKHPLSTSSIYTIHSVLFVQFTCLALFLQPLFQVLVLEWKPLLCTTYISSPSFYLPFTHTHPFNGPLSRTTRVSQYQKRNTNLDLLKQ